MNEYLNLLENLIRCKAVSENIENVNRAIGTMRSFLESKGVFCKTEILDGREILYASAMPGKEQDILLNSHLDVVPAPDSMFEPEIKDGNLIPASLEDSFWQMATILISSVILSYGQEYYAAYQLGLEGEGFCNMMSAGFMTAAMSLSSNAIGAKDQKEFEVCFKRLHFFCLIISAITMTFLTFFSGTVLSFMTDKPELIVIATGYLYAMIFSQYPQHMKQIVSGYIRATGHTETSMVINLVGLWVVRVPLVLLFGNVLKMPILWIWWAFNIDQWIRLVLSWFYLKHFHVMNYMKTAEVRCV